MGTHWENIGRLAQDDRGRGRWKYLCGNSLVEDIGRLAQGVGGNTCVGTH